LVIVGGGIAGLSAACRLDKRGFRDFVIVEMEQRAGGNARWGENEVTAYPWGAHYVPVPGRRAVLVRELFEELGILRDGQWEERYLCFDPQERLFLHGAWQDGLEPTIGLGTRDREELRRFAARMAEFRATGRFTIPMALGAGDAASPLDRVSMAEWLQHEGFTSPVVRWYVDYACRDDYGALLSDASAWAGVHYFASREPEERGPLTWPEGNGWIVRQLLARVGKYLETNAFVHRTDVPDPPGHSTGRPPMARPPRTVRYCCSATGASGKRRSSPISSERTPTSGRASRGSTSCAWGTRW